jgi:hypothetical protein
VVDVCCLQHVDDIDAALGIIHTMLKPGGSLFSIMACADHDDLMTGAFEGATMRRLTLTQLYRIFGYDSDTDTKWSIKVETMNHTDNGKHISHWIVEATK